MHTQTQIAEINAYAAADSASAAADAHVFGLIGRTATAAQLLTKYVLEGEAAAACLKAAKHGPAHSRAQYLESARLYAAFAEAAAEAL